MIQGRLWWSSGTSARPRQGFVPPDVRHSCAGGGAVGPATGLKPTWFHPSVTGACTLPPGMQGRGLAIHRPRGFIVAAWSRGEAPQAAQRRIRAKNCQLSKAMSFALDVELEFCKWLYGEEIILPVLGKHQKVCGNQGSARVKVLPLKLACRTASNSCGGAGVGANTRAELKISHAFWCFQHCRPAYRNDPRNLVRENRPEGVFLEGRGTGVGCCGMVKGILSRRNRRAPTPVPDHSTPGASVLELGGPEGRGNQCPDSEVLLIMF